MLPIDIIGVVACPSSLNVFKCNKMIRYDMFILRENKR